MKKVDLIAYWLQAAKYDYDSMHNFIGTGENHWALYLGQLLLEKTLKALLVQNTDQHIMKTHNLIQLAETAGLQLTDELSDQLDLISTFNISTRYPDEKFDFYRKCTTEYATKQLQIIEDIYLWLLSQIKPE